MDDDALQFLIVALLWSLFCVTCGGVAVASFDMSEELCPLVVENKALCSIDSSSKAVLDYVKMERGLLK